jgi:hypothetical protein
MITSEKITSENAAIDGMTRRAFGKLPAVGLVTATVPLTIRVESCKTAEREC